MSFGSNLLLGLLLGTIGFGYFLNGRKLQRSVPLGCGLLLMVLPYFVESAVGLGVAGGVLVVTPWVVRR